MKLSLSRADDAPLDWLDDGAVETLGRICESLGPADRTASVVVVDDETIQSLNARFRGKDQPTDVISFSYLDEEPALQGPAEDDPAAEIFISHQTIARDAADSGVEVSHLFLRMGIHGLLHALGRGHDTDEEAERMESEERDILSAHIGPGPAAKLF